MLQTPTHAAGADATTTARPRGRCAPWTADGARQRGFATVRDYRQAMGLSKHYPQAMESKRGKAVRVRDRATVPGRQPGRPPNSSVPAEELQRRKEQREQKKAAKVAEQGGAVRKRDRTTVPGRRPGRPPNSSLPPEELQRRQERQEQKKAARVAEPTLRQASDDARMRLLSLLGITASTVAPTPENLQRWQEQRDRDHREREEKIKEGKRGRRRARAHDGLQKRLRLPSREVICFTPVRPQEGARWCRTLRLWARLPGLL